MKKYSDLSEKEKKEVRNRTRLLEKAFMKNAFLLWILKAYEDGKLDEENLGFKDAKKMLENPNVRLKDIVDISFDSSEYVEGMADFQEIIASIINKKE